MQLGIILKKVVCQVVCCEAVFKEFQKQQRHVATTKNTTDKN